MSSNIYFSENSLANKLIMIRDLKKDDSSDDFENTMLVVFDEVYELIVSKSVNQEYLEETNKLLEKQPYFRGDKGLLSFITLSSAYLDGSYMGDKFQLKKNLFEAITLNSYK
ncbi:hypothetical protein GQ473_00145 [archaeon]|nr:hypothetical protein [archaeon]